MTILTVALACVFVIPYHLDGEEWQVRIKVMPTEDGTNREILDVVNAIAPDGSVITGSDWDEKVIEAGIINEFWAAVINFMLIQMQDLAIDLGSLGEA